MKKYIVHDQLAYEEENIGNEYMEDETKDLIGSKYPPELVLYRREFDLNTLLVSDGDKIRITLKNYRGEPVMVLEENLLEVEILEDIIFEVID